jgi:carbonic anhydrase
VAIVLLCAAGAMGQTWHHDPSSLSGPNYWGSVAPQDATCGTAGSGKFVPVGAKQTPIDIKSVETVLGVLPEISFHYNDTPMEVENTGHVVEVVYEPGSYIKIGPNVTDQYFLSQFHFHAPSEHMIDGIQFDAELHLVHTNRIGELLVVGVLLTKSKDAPAGVFDNIMGNAPGSVATKSLQGTVNAMDLLPMAQSFFTYTGSLTTPPCTEGVRWFVLTTPVPVTSAFIEQLHSIIGQFPGYNGYPNNNRPTRSFNGRDVIVSQ